MLDDYAYDVAISCAGEDAEIAEELFQLLQAQGVRVYYYRKEQVAALGSNLAEYLAGIYGQFSRFCIVLVSKHYVASDWTRFELKHLQSRFIKEDGFLIQLVLDGTPLPAIPDTIGYHSLEETPLAEAVDVLVRKLRPAGGPISRGTSATEWEERGRAFFAAIATPEYLAWQQELLETLYGDMEIVRVFGRAFPAALVRSATPSAYPFDDLCTLREVRVPEFPISAEQMDFIRMLGRSLKWPQMKGFAVQRMHADAEGRILGIDAVTATFFQNLVTTHVMELEAYRLFERDPSSPQARGAEALLAELPRRAQYHAGRPGREAIYQPAASYPLISVQAMVIFRTAGGGRQAEYRIVIAERSNEVVVKPGFFQFHPAGGFEVYGRQSDDEDYLVELEFDVRGALFREYAEELFDARDLQVKSTNRDSYQAIFGNPDVERLVGWLESGSATIEYLGVVVDLSLLRPELSFLITIDHPDFLRAHMVGNWESRNLHSMTFDQLRRSIATGKLHGSSAGLLQLAMENERFRTSFHL